VVAVTGRERGESLGHLQAEAISRGNLVFDIPWKELRKCFQFIKSDTVSLQRPRNERKAACNLQPSNFHTLAPPTPVPAFAISLRFKGFF
jgi:hypothetical protein